MKYSGIETTIIQVKAVAVTVKRGDQEENKQWLRLHHKLFIKRQFHQAAAVQVLKKIKEKKVGEF